MTPPHQARVQRWGYAAVALAALVAALDARGLLLGLVALGAVAGAVAVHRRSSPLAIGAGALLVGSVVPAGSLDPGLAGYARGFALGALVLCVHELVAQTARYDRAHKLVDEQAASEASLDRVTDEALKTLGARLALALALALAPVALALALAAGGPALLRASVETASPLGVAVLATGVLGALTLLVLARGARLRRGDKPTETPEVAADAPQ